MRLKLLNLGSDEYKFTNVFSEKVFTDNFLNSVGKHIAELCFIIKKKHLN